jgi:hypothetical protein
MRYWPEKTRADCVSLAVAIAAVRVEQLAPAFGQHDRAIAVSVERHGPHKTLLAEVSEIALARVGRPAVVVP